MSELQDINTQLWEKKSDLRVDISQFWFNTGKCYFISCIYEFISRNCDFKYEKVRIVRYKEINLYCIIIMWQKQASIENR